MLQFELLRTAKNEYGDDFHFCEARCHHSMIISAKIRFAKVDEFDQIIGMIDWLMDHTSELCSVPIFLYEFYTGRDYRENALDSFSVSFASMSDYVAFKLMFADWIKDSGVYVRNMDVTGCDIFYPIKTVEEILQYRPNAVLT